jgi:hypothetical protein
VQLVGVFDEHRADDLAAHEQGLTGCPAIRSAAYLTVGERFTLGTLTMLAGKAHGKTRARTGVRQGLLEPAGLSDLCLGLQPVLSVVSFQDDRAATGDRSFNLTTQQVVGDVLAVGHLQRFDEFVLGAAVGGVEGSMLDHLLKGSAQRSELIGTSSH